MIACSFTYGQSKQDNSIVVIEEDTFALVKISDIRKSQQKQSKYLLYKEFSDSLLVEIAKRDKEIFERENLRQQSIVSSKLDNSKLDLLELKYQSLDKDYKKLTKVNKLNGIIGGGVSAAYSLEDRIVNNVALNVNLGLMLQEKYITSFDFGIGVDRSIFFGLNGGLVF